MTQSRARTARRDPTGPNQTTLKRLFARSGDRCAFPRCSVALVQDDTLVGEICHIKAANPSGPRYDPQQTAVQRHAYDNLLLLCPTHHTIIDDDPEAYTVERLVKMKTDHEAKIKTDHEAHSVLSKKAQLLVDQSVITANQSGGITAHTVHQTFNIQAPTVHSTQAAERQSIVARARAFHRDQVAKIATGAASVAILDGGALVLHLVPFSAVDEQPVSAFGEISRNPNWFPPITTDRARDSRIDHNGLLTGSNAEGLTRPQRAYVKVFRFAAVESVASSLARGREHNFLILPQIQDMVIRYTYYYANSLHSFGVEPPVAVFVSLVNVKGMKLLQTFIENAFLEDLPFRPLLDDRLEFDMATLETMPQDFTMCGRILMPILRHLANASGLSSPPYFDSAGNYTAKLR
jgi:hypothetical protein